MAEIEKVEIRNLSKDDYHELLISMKEAYATWAGALWSEASIDKLIDIFPEGQLAAVVDGKVVGCALSLIVKYDLYGDEHTYSEITGNYTFDTHNPKGDTLYGIEIFLGPEYRGLRLGRRLYDSRKELCEKLNLKAIVFGGRIPGYYEHSDEMTPREYIQKVKFKELYDPILTFQMSNDFHVKKVLRNYMPGDAESKAYAVLLQWDNIYYEKPSVKPSVYKSTVRLGLIQWQMRRYDDVDGLFEQVEYFVDAVSGYKSVV